MINTTIQTTKKRILNVPKIGYFRSKTASFITESSGFFLRAEKSDSKIILSQKRQFYNADEMAVNKNIMFLMYENQAFWI
jgi:hypothetical protein